MIFFLNMKVQVIKSCLKFILCNFNNLILHKNINNVYENYYIDKNQSVQAETELNHKESMLGISPLDFLGKF